MIDKREMERVKHSEQCEGVSARSSTGKSMSNIQDQHDNSVLLSKRWELALYSHLSLSCLALQQCQKSTAFLHYPAIFHRIASLLFHTSVLNSLCNPMWYDMKLADHNTWHDLSMLIP
jgi:hypothetical protein